MPRAALCAQQYQGDEAGEVMDLWGLGVFDDGSAGLDDFSRRLQVRVGVA